LQIYYEDWAPEDTPAGKRDRARASAHEASYKRALQAHLKIIFGTDIGGMAWTESIAREFPRMVDFGMSPMDAIQAATSRPAEMLDMKGEIGVVAAGAYADIIAVQGDPLKDISTLEHVQFVMHNGAIYKNEPTK
jgi:imidazolonepropionase-like amidohydrolase